MEPLARFSSQSVCLSVCLSVQGQSSVHQSESEPWVVCWWSVYVCVACCFLDLDLPWSLWPGSVLCPSVWAMSGLLMISLCVACCFLDVDLVWWPWSLLSLSVRLSICLSHDWSVDDQYVCLLASFLMLISCGDFDQGQYCVCLLVTWSVSPSVCLLSHLSELWMVCWSVCVLFAVFLMLISSGDFGQGQYCVFWSVSWSVCLSVSPAVWAMSVVLMINLCVACYLFDVDLLWRLWPGSALCLSVCWSHQCSVNDQSVGCFVPF